MDYFYLKIFGGNLRNFCSPLLFSSSSAVIKSMFFLILVTGFVHIQESHGIQVTFSRPGKCWNQA